MLRPLHKSSRRLMLNNGMSGLWSVWILKFNPIRKLEKRSQAQVKANSSYSIWVYFSSVGNSDLDMYEIGLMSPFACSWSKTAPSL